MSIMKLKTIMKFGLSHKNPTLCNSYIQEYENFCCTHSITSSVSNPDNMEIHVCHEFHEFPVTFIFTTTVLI